MRALLAAAVAGAALFTAPGQAVATHPGCDNPIDVLCNEGYCPGEACTPIICAVWYQGRCIL